MYQPITQVTEVAHTPEKVRRTLAITQPWVAAVGWAHASEAVPADVHAQATSGLAPAERIGAPLVFYCAVAAARCGRVAA